MLDRQFEAHGAFIASEMSREWSRLYICKICGEPWAISGDRDRPPQKGPVGFNGATQMMTGCSLGPVDGVRFRPGDNRPVHPHFYHSLCGRSEGHEWVKVKNDREPQC